jgi:hypothetical protein
MLFGGHDRLEFLGMIADSIKYTLGDGNVFVIVIVGAFFFVFHCCRRVVDGL